MKELLLIFEFETAPEALKTAATELRKVTNELAKKESNLSDLSAEVQELKKKQSQLERDFQINLKKWEPEGTKIKAAKGEV